MTLSDYQKGCLDRKNSTSITSVGYTTLALLISSLSYFPAEALGHGDLEGYQRERGIRQNITGSSVAAKIRDFRYEDQALIQAISNVYERLAESQIDLDELNKGILYDNLWDLYE